MGTVLILLCHWVLTGPTDVLRFLASKERLFRFFEFLSNRSEQIHYLPEASDPNKRWVEAPFVLAAMSEQIVRTGQSVSNAGTLDRKTARDLMR